MSDPTDPPRKFYSLKPREFERVNPPAPEPSEPVRSAAAPPPHDPAQPIDVNELIRHATGAKSAPKVNAPGNRENEVHAMLRENLARDNALGLNEVAPPKRRLRGRRRDYLVLMVCGNTFIAVAYAVEIFVGFQVQCLAAGMPGEFMNLVRYAVQNPASWAMAPVGMLFFSGCITWLMFGVMDNY